MAYRGISSDARFGSVLGAAWSKVFSRQTLSCTKSCLSGINFGTGLRSTEV